MTKLTDLLKQRRRWLNGTFFALIYTLSNWLRVWTDSHHNFLRKIVISFEFMYLTILTILGTWFGMGILYTIFYNLAISTFKSSYATEQVGCFALAINTQGPARALQRSTPVCTYPTYCCP